MMAAIRILGKNVDRYKTHDKRENQVELLLNG
jgi:hypothetical protein